MRCCASIKKIDSVYDAYRVVPGARVLRLDVSRTALGGA